MASEVPDKVAGPDHSIVLGAAVEGVRAVRTIVADFGTRLELGRQPMLPADRELIVGRRRARALALRIVIEFRPEREVIQRLRRVVEVGEGANSVGVAP